ncbi:MAG: tetratricopeptide repeat protein [Sphingobacteriales bacterium JAD_PAG50586_3]|nr:MAG: tetratricopeptide repeat protein [Sphingobacteriales bacterium JAD_PAG50586_3]
MIATKLQNMNDITIESLREALKHSPDNTPLRLLLADTLLSLNRLEEAETAYSTLLKISNITKAKVGLATVFFKKGSYSACNVVLEEVIEKGTNEISVYTLYAKGLLKENSIPKAIEAYKKALAIDKSYFDEELDSQLRQRGSNKVTETEEETDNRFLQKPTINFSDVGGMDAVKKEIELKIIKPLLHPELYKAYGKKLAVVFCFMGHRAAVKHLLLKQQQGK